MIRLLYEYLECFLVRIQFAFDKTSSGACEHGPKSLPDY